MLAVNQYDTTVLKCLMDESTGIRQMDEKILVIDVFNGNAQVADSRSGRIGGNGVFADGYYRGRKAS